MSSNYINVHCAFRTRSIPTVAFYTLCMSFYWKKIMMPLLDAMHKHKVALTFAARVKGEKITYRKIILYCF